MSQPSDPHGFDGPVEDFVGPRLRGAYEDIVRTMHASRRIPDPEAQPTITIEDGVFSIHIDTIPVPEDPNGSEDRQP